MVAGLPKVQVPSLGGLLLASLLITARSCIGELFGLRSAEQPAPEKEAFNRLSQKLKQP